jgi:16S rRNA (cytosine1402-N4)-methyltransferase
MEHIPVLLKESLEGLNIKPDGVYADATLGRAGHATEIVNRLTTGRLIAIDRDDDALNEAKEILSGYEKQTIYVQGNFKDLSQILSKAGIEKVNGIMLDLGVSSPQLDDAARGFSYMQDAALDMRMDKRETQTAYDLVNNLQEEELRKIFFEYGEERYSKSIAREIVKKRDTAPIDTTFRLNEIIFSAIPAAARREPQHPSKRCFQALRIAVNDELGSLKQMLESIPSLLKPEGRICIISFHSLEDRIVKRAFTAYSKTCTCPGDIPVCVCNTSPILKLVTRKPITADSDEVKRNPRARSAKLRIAERL